MKENIMTLEKEDFDLTKEFELFDTLYSIEKEGKNDIKEWKVMGYELKISSDKRNFDYLLVSSPITKFVAQNIHTTLNNLKIRDFVSTTKEEIIKIKRNKIENEFNKALEGL